MARRSKAEQKLIDFSRESFGDRLSELLLCGYGEERVLSSCDLVIKSVDSAEAETSLRLIIISEAPAAVSPALPRRRDPLVLLALLRLYLTKGAEPTGRMLYTSGELLNILGWSITSGSMVAAADAVTKYFHLFYQLGDGSRAAAAEQPSEHLHKLRPLCGYHSVSGEGAGLGSKVTEGVTFSLDFVGPLSRRKLFGVDWDRVESLTPLPVEFFNL